MGHNPSNRDVKNSERKQALETRTPIEIIQTMRNNLTNPITIMKSDVALLMAVYDDQVSLIAAQAAAIEGLKGELTTAQNELHQMQVILDAANKGLETTRADRDRFAHELVAWKAKNEVYNERP